MKRIITCSDGTWNLPGDTEGGKVVRTNVQKIFEAICNEDPSGIHQIKYYDEGIGVEGSKLRRMIDGAIGGGIDQNILDIYKFICWNYSQGDEIYLFGFSRGAYTARSLAGLIRNSGLVKNNNLTLINKAYEIYRDRSEETSPDGPVSRSFREKYSQPDVRIKFIGVWDTVGSLGVPVNILGSNKKYEFHDTKLSSYVDYAYQALALDERRKSFKPAVWQQSEYVIKHRLPQVLEQVWFCGVHSDVGGGYPEEGLSDIPLAWMLEKAEKTGLAFEKGYVQQNIHPNALAAIHDSFAAPFSWQGQHVRKIAERPDSHETVHPSVYDRMQAGLGYKPENVPALSLAGVQ
ncbi:DUF2235 domain-containing protein [Pedobacter sp. SYSU D00535]|uniref:DUF2235 domain-containing protein n=1 Tax=Pedobacter sp. SYSU D00535 TaxID=2810308 RepID=UPI001A960126|nr:DUF2235 domain-containing protein [Pedobacter sp. SYSU D00535]